MMRKWLFLLLCVLSTKTMVAQDEETKEKVNKAKDRIVVELALENLINKPDTIKISGLSRGFNTYFMYDIPLGKSRLSLAPGIGIGTSNFYHKSNKIVSDSSKTYFVPIDKSTFDVKKNKIGLTYVDIPIELRYRSKPNSKNTSWKLAAGFKIGFLIHNKWKYKGLDLDGSGKEVKFKQYNVANLEKLRYGVTLRGGYGAFNLFVNYYISSLFKAENGPAMHPISFGIAINGL